MILWNIFILQLFFGICLANKKGEVSVEEEKYGVKYASRCEVCKLVVRELENTLTETGKSHDVVVTGYSLDAAPKKKTKYVHSELRLVETIENVCEKILQYNIHKERKDSTRFEKGMSTTFKVLHGLVDKGVKVDLGIPLELWDKPSAEITHMKSQCDLMIEHHEGDIENWYFHHQDQPLKTYLCEQRVLNREEMGCLDEVFNEEETKEEEEEEEEQGPAIEKSKTTKKTKDSKQKSKEEL